MLVVAGCGGSKEAPDEVGEPEPTREARTLRCTAVRAVCDEAKQRIAEIETRLATLDCNAGGVDRAVCEGQRRRLETEREAIFDKWDTASDEPAVTAPPSPPPPKTRGIPRRKSDDVDMMEIEVSDE